MKILLINVVYGSGSTGIIVDNLYKYYKERGNDVFVIYGRGKKNTTDRNVIKCTSEFESKIYHFLSLFNGNLYGGMPLSTKRILSKIKKIKPDIVHLHCLNGFFVNIYKLIDFLKRRKIKTILTNHAEFMFTGNCGITLNCNKWINNECSGCERVHEFAGKHAANKTHNYYLKLKEALHGFDTLSVTCVSQWLTNRVNLSPLYKSTKNVTILNPVVISDFADLKNPYEEALIKSGKEKIALFVCTQLNNEEKGFMHFINLANELKESKYLFVLIGADFLENDSKNIISLGKVDNSKLAIFYKYADVTLILSKRETFSMVVAESLCCGTPVCGFLSGGPETIAFPEYSSFVGNGDIAGLKKILEENEFVSNDSQRKELIVKAKAKFDLNVIGRQYLEL